ncbi:MAG TPA: cation-translocating P-type ATPase [Abditibacteriaceae bacterium]|jgi:Cd2+/Zn2+-exporting ATPase
MKSLEAYSTEAPALQNETIAVRGMDCSSCARTIEKTVARMPGVASAEVSYSSEKLRVSFDSAQTDRAHIEATVAKLGYATGKQAATRAPHNHSEHSHDHSHHNHSHGDHAAQGSHGEASTAREFGLSFLAGVALAAAWLGERFLSLPHTAAIALYCVAYAAGGWNVAKHGISSALRGRLDIDFLMVIAAVGAAWLGDWPEGAFLLFLFSISHALEHRAMDKARGAIRALQSVRPATARVRRETDGSTVEIEVGVEDVLVGETVLVRPGERIAVDGIILRGASAVEQSALTGESVPLEKDAGDAVLAGSINGDGALEIETTRAAEDSTLARVLHLVEEAQDQKSPSQTFAERFETIFVPCVLGVVVLAAIVPPLAGWLAWDEALRRAITALVGASPCALALAAPAAMLAGIARAAQSGVLVKGGAHLENLGDLRAIAFDKTGTLTRGTPTVSEIIAATGRTETEVLTIAASIEASSNHPLALAVMQHALEQKLAVIEAQNVRAVGGRGAQGEVTGRLVRVGNARWMQENALELSAEFRAALERLGQSGQPTMFVGVDNAVAGIIAFQDALRPEARETVQRLRAQGLSHIALLSGDNERVANRLGESVGISDVRAALLPEDKVTALHELQQKHGVVAMVGDGVNDAPALAAATIGIAIGTGGTGGGATDAALETADAVLMSGDLSRLPFAVALSRQTRRIVRQNLWISLGVIAGLVPAALLGWAPLALAVVFHEGSTLVVVINALRLLRFKERASMVEIDRTSGAALESSALRH